MHLIYKKWFGIMSCKCRVTTAANWRGLMMSLWLPSTHLTNRWLSFTAAHSLSQLQFCTINYCEHNLLRLLQCIALHLNLWPPTALIITVLNKRLWGRIKSLDLPFSAIKWHILVAYSLPCAVRMSKTHLNPTVFPLWSLWSCHSNLTHGSQCLCPGNSGLCSYI